jgi:hypothetical protein
VRIFRAGAFFKIGVQLHARGQLHEQHDAHVIAEILTNALRLEDFGICSTCL